MQLQLIKSEHFGEIQADIYSSGEEMFMTANQLCDCLNEKRSTFDMRLSRKPKLKTSEFSVSHKLLGTDGKLYNTRLFNEEGIYEITLLSESKKGDEFRAWVRKILKSLRSGQAQIVKPLSPIEMLRLQNQVLSDLDTRMETLEEKVDKQITLDHGQQRTLQNVVSKRAYERVGQAYTFDIKENKSRFFNAIYKDLKNRFGVSSYRDINVQNYTDAIHYVKAWIEPAELRG